MRTNSALSDFSCVLISNNKCRRYLSLEAAEVRKSPTPKQLTDLAEKHNLLFREIQHWREVQFIYMPCVGTLLAETLIANPESITPILAETALLLLPSSLSSELRASPAMSTLVDRETWLHITQAEDVLADVRCQRHIISGLWQFKHLNVDGTRNKANTQMWALYNCFSLQTQCCILRYRGAHQGLLSLDAQGSWRDHLHDLKDIDVCGSGKDNTAESNGQFEISWIWLVPQVSTAPDMGESEEVLDESMRIEWMKSR